MNFLKNLFNKIRFNKKSETISSVFGLGSPIQVQGQFYGSVVDKDGNIKQVIQLQDNVITDAGMLYYFANNHTAGYWSDPGISNFEGEVDYANNGNPILPTFYENSVALFIGDGVGTPVVNNTHLYNTRLMCRSNSYSSQQHSVSNFENPNTEHPNHMKISVTKSFIFSPEYNAYNLTELGLGRVGNGGLINFEKFYANDNTEYRNSIPKTPSSNDYSKSSWNSFDYFLITHANFKDAQGNNITVSLEPGEKLTLFYTINYYVDVRVTSGTVQLTRINPDKTVSTVNYDYRCMLSCINKPPMGNNAIYPHIDTMTTLNDNAVITKDSVIIGHLGCKNVTVYREEESPDSDFSNFNIDTFTAAIKAERDKKLTSGSDITSLTNLSEAQWKTALKTLPYIDANYVDNTAFIKSFSLEGYNGHSGAIDDLTNSSLINETLNKAYLFNGTNPKYAEEFALYNTAPSTVKTSVVRYSYPVGSITTDDNDVRIRAFKVFRASTGYQTAFFPDFLFIVSEQGTNRGISKKDTEYLEWAFSVSMTRYTGA